MCKSPGGLVTKQILAEVAGSRAEAVAFPTGTHVMWGLLVRGAQQGFRSDSSGMEGELAVYQAPGLVLHRP